MGFSDWFSPGWQSKDPAARLKAVSRADTKAIERIALEARHDDVFQAAVARLATPSARYAVLYHLTRSPQKTHLTPEVLRRRQQHLVEQITDPHLLEAIAAEFDPEVALLAMAKLDSGELVRLLARNPPEPVQKAALARVTDPSALLAIAWDNPEPAIRQAAIRQITSVPVLAKAVYGSSGVKDTWALRKRLEELLKERAQARDWPAIQGVISLCWDFEEKKRLLLMLPAAEIDPKDLQVIAKGTDTLTHTYSLLRPILEKMQQAGWRIQETIDEKTCPNCQGTGKVDDGYNCRDCAGQGRIKTVALSGSFQNKSFKFTALG